MKTFLSLATAICAWNLSAAMAADIGLAQCPEPVQKAIQAHADGGKIDIEARTTDAATVYVADIDLPGDHDRKLHIGADGKLLMTRQEMLLDEAPSAIQDAIRQLIPSDGRLDEVTKVTAGKTVTYRLEIDRPQEADLYFQLDKDGTVISRARETQE